MTRKLLRKAAVAERYDVDPRTVDRWRYDPKLNFPPPKYINQIPFWDGAELEKWDGALPRQREGATA